MSRTFVKRHISHFFSPVLLRRMLDTPTSAPPEKMQTTSFYESPMKCEDRSKFQPMRAGFTLVEVLVTLLVTSVVIVTLMTFATTSLVQYSVAEARASLLSESHHALDVVNNDIRLSASADENNRWEDANAPGAPGDLYSWESDSDTLVLAAAAEDGEGNILFADPSQYISHKNNSIFFVENNVLYKRTLAAPEPDNEAVTTCPEPEATSSCPADKELLENVSTFTARYLDGQDNEVMPPSARSVELTVATTTTKYGKDITVDYTTRMVFRND